MFEGVVYAWISCKTRAMIGFHKKLAKLDKQFKIFRFHFRGNGKKSFPISGEHNSHFVNVSYYYDLIQMFEA